MKKWLFTVLLVNSLLWFGLSSLMSVAKADDYTKAVIGHVVKEKVSGNKVDTQKLFEQEMEKIAHQFTLDMIVVMQRYLPSILDNIAADLRLQADKKHKCELLKGSKIEDDCI